MILETLQAGPRHGWASSRRIRETSREVLRVHQGSLYPALYRLEDRGRVRAEWRISPERRRAKFYRLTPAGRKRLAAERGQWEAFCLAVNHVLQGA